MRNTSAEKLFTKFVRAKAKTQYHKYKKDECWVCGSSENLELHHVYPLSDIIHDWLREHNIKNPSNDVELREELLNDVADKVYNPTNLITLCKTHHRNVHTLFGQTYGGKMAEKVNKYLTKQKEKFNGKVQ